jgi:hypothetical protein
VPEKAVRPLGNFDAGAQVRNKQILESGLPWLNDEVCRIVSRRMSTKVRIFIYHLEKTFALYSQFNPRPS